VNSNADPGNQKGDGMNYAKYTSKEEDEINGNIAKKASDEVYLKELDEEITA
jgi:hypothetical protein